MKIVSYGDIELDLSSVEQLVESSQTRAIADLLQTLGQGRNGSIQPAPGRSIKQLIDMIEAEFDSDQGLDAIRPGRLQLYHDMRPNHATMDTLHLLFTSLR